MWTHLSITQSWKRIKNVYKHVDFKGVGYPQMDQKVCLNMVKKDQLCAIGLKKKD